MAKRKYTIFVQQCHNCLCRKPKRIDKKLLEPLSKYSKAAGWKADIQKPVTFLNTSKNK